MEILNILNDLNIKYELLSHQAVYTVEEAKKIENMIEGIGCKNLFLKDKYKNYFIFVIKENKRAKLILDQALTNEKILLHPNTNTKTLSLLFDDLIKFIEYTNHKYTIYKDWLYGLKRSI